MFNLYVDGYHDNKREKEYGFVKALDGSGLKKVNLPRAIDNGMRFFGLEYEMEFEDGFLSKSSDMCECWACGGSGEVSHECEHCNGTGEIHVYDASGELVPITDEDDERYGDVCDNCGGVGYIDVRCEDCDGSGEVESEDDDGELNSGVYDFSDDLMDTFVFERDGSLNNGFEMVVEPMSRNALSWFLEHRNIQNIIYDSIEDNNGIHIHINRPSEDDVRKLRVIMAHLEDDLCNMTRISSYANPYQNTFGHMVDGLNNKYVSSKNKLNKVDIIHIANKLEAKTLRKGSRLFKNTKVMEVVREALAKASGERYMMMNERNHKTIEFRLFNWTNNVERINNYVKFLDTILDLVRDFDEDTLYRGSYTIDEEFNVVFIPKPKKTKRVGTYASTKTYSEVGVGEVEISPNSTSGNSFTRYNDNNLFFDNYFEYLNDYDDTYGTSETIDHINSNYIGAIVKVDKIALQRDPQNIGVINEMKDAEYFKLTSISIKGKRRPFILRGIPCNKDGVYIGSANETYVYDTGWVKSMTFKKPVKNRVVQKDKNYSYIVL